MALVIRSLGSAPPSWLKLAFYLVLAIGATWGLASWQNQARQVQGLVVGSPGDGDLLRGFHGPEQSEFFGGRTFRWTKPAQARVRLWGPPLGEESILNLWLSVPNRPQKLTVHTPNGARSIIRVKQGLRRYRILLPEQPLGRLNVELRSPRYSTDDPRTLGVALWRVRLEQAGAQHPLAPLGELLMFPQLPLAGLLLVASSRRRLLAAGVFALAALALILLSRFASLDALLLASFAWYAAVALLLARLLVWLLARFAPISDQIALRALAFAFAVVVLLTYVPALHSDGRGYYAYARSLFVDGDLDMTDEYEVIWGGNPWKKPTVTGMAPNPWSIGPAFLWAPLYLPAHWLLSALGGPWPADGYAKPYVVAATMATSLSVLVFLLVCYRIARRWCSPGAAALAAFTMLLGSTLWYYSMRMGTFAHALSAVTCAVYLLTWLRLEERQDLRRWLAFGLAAGVMTLTYWICALLLIGPALTFLRRALVKLRAQDWWPLSRLALGAALAGLAALLAFLPQMIAWNLIYGSPLVQPAATPRATGESHLLEMLLQPYGLIPWTPAMFLGLCGLLLLWRREPWLAAGLLLSFGTYFYYNSILGDWHGSGAFGLRRITSLAPWCALGLALLYDWLLRTGKGTLALWLALCTSFWMLMLLIRSDFFYFRSRTPLDLAELPPAEFYLAPGTLPAWEISAYFKSGYFLQALAGNEDQAVALAALLLLAASVGATWWWAGRQKAEGKR